MRAILMTAMLLAFSVWIQAAPGDLDPGFGDGGKVIMPGGWLNGTALAIQADGKIIVAGFQGYPLTGGGVLARYHADGSSDMSFGTGGQIYDDVGQYFSAVAVQPDGKIVVAGSVWYIGPFCHGPRSLALRYNTDGSRDLSFGLDGMAVITYAACQNATANSLAIQNDGKIVVAGASYDWDTEDLKDIGAARLNSNGTLDTTFAGDGTFTTASPAIHDIANAVAVDAAGKIVLAGYARDASRAGTKDNFLIQRLNANGTYDNNFNYPFGLVYLDYFGNDDRANALAILPDGKIIIAGYTTAASNLWRFALLRLNANGRADTAFGSSGKVTTSFGGPDNIAYGVASVAGQGKIVAVGGTGDFALARYNTGGSLDTTFSGDGKQTTDFGKSDIAYAVAIQADGKIVAAGTSYNAASGDLALARYLP